MSSRPTAPRAAGNQLLAGGPRPREELISAMALHVPYGRAIRESDRERARQERRRRRNGEKAARPKGTSDEMARASYGARAVVAGIAQNAIRTGAWVRLPDGRIALREWQLRAVPDAEAP